MSEKRRGLGRGLGALIPNAAVATEDSATEGGSNAPKGRPVDVFFPSAGTRPYLEGTGEADRAAGRPSSSAAQVAEVLRGPRRSAAGGRKSAAAGGAKGAKTNKPETAQETKTADSKADPLEVEAGLEGDAPNAVAPSESSRNLEKSEFDDTRGQSDPATDDVSRETLVEVPGAKFAEVPVGSIHPNRKQPRSVFDEEDMAELVHSVREIGILQPIVIRPSSEQNDHEYELVMGERRWRAAQQAGLEAVPAIIRSTSDDDLLRDALLENLHRSQLNPLEEAAAYQQLLEDFGCTHDELADRIGRSRPQVSNTIRLMKLPPLVQRRVAAGVLSAGHARALLGLADPAEMEKLAQKIVAEGLSVRATEEIVALSDSLRRPKRETKPRLGARHERLDFLATSLSDRLDTNVKITLGAKKGRVSIEFASVDDLNRIMGVLSPSEN
jgi:ParB family transcriptional regulator, chromosome partitioning protein